MTALTIGQIAAFEALMIGFAFAGLLASAFQLVAQEPVSFRLLQGRDFAAIAAVPLLLVTAPFIILRNTLRGRRYEKRQAHFVAMATIIACLWSLACGTVILHLAGSLITS